MAVSGRGPSWVRMAVSVGVGVTGGTSVVEWAGAERFGRVRTLVSQDWPTVAGQFGVLLFDLLPLL